MSEQDGKTTPAGTGPSALIDPVPSATSGIVNSSAGDGAGLLSSGTKILAGVAALLLLAHLVFVLSFQYDRWDGVILDYWLRSGDFRGVEVMFVEAAGPITLTLLRLVDFLKNLLALPFHSSWFSALGIIAYATGTAAIARAMEFDRNTALLAVIVTLTSPLLTLAASSMNGIIMLYIGLCWIGLGLLEKGRLGHIVALALLVVSCQLWSNFATIMAFLGYRALRLRKVKPEHVSAALLASITIGFLLLGFSPTGLYGGYNQFQVNDPLNLVETLFESTFASFVGPPFLVCLLAIFIRSLSGFPGQSHLIKACFVIALFFAGAMPYAVVDKYPPPVSAFWPGFIVADSAHYRVPGSYNYYNYRHLLSVSCWVSILIAASIAASYDIAQRAFRSRVWPTRIAAGAIAIALMAGSITNLARAAATNRKQDLEAAEIVRAIPALCPDIASICRASIQGGPSVVYQLNYLYAIAMGGRGLIINTLHEAYQVDLAFRLCISEAHAVQYAMDLRLCRQLADQPRQK